MKFKPIITILIFISTIFASKAQILIISADKYIDSLQPFIEWKNQKGMWTETIKMSDIGTSYSDIKDFVSEFYKERSNRYLLLVGDANDVPTHISYGITDPNEYSAYSDAEYGYINSTDYPPAVLVGRFSGESIEDIKTQVDRTIHYERDIDASATWLSSSLGIANPYSYETGDNNETDNEHIVNLNNNLKEYGYSTATTNSNNTLKDYLNNGCGLINYIGHGYTESWQTTGFAVSDVKNLTNTNKLPIIIAAGCQNGHFRLGTCLAEGFLRGRDTNNNPIGAVGMIAFTTQIYWNPPMLGQDEFARILTSDSIGFTKSFGEVINAAYKSVIGKYKGSGADVACQWALFGDPSLIVRTKAPSFMEITHDEKINTDNNSFTIYCNSDYATATLWCDGKIVDSEVVTDGSVTLDIDGVNSGDLAKLTITAQDKISYQTDILATQESGVKEMTIESEFEIFPNPTNGDITINGSVEKIEIKVFDCNGKYLFDKEVLSNTPFSLNKDKGVYFVYIVNDKSTHKVLCN